MIGVGMPELQETALRVREHVIRLAGKGGCFVGASLSCADLMVYLYREFLRVNRDNPEDPGRDYFLLSKGHAVPALYGTFVELGWLSRERLASHLRTEDCLYWHPNRGVPGVEFHAGSLGHMLPVAAGVALDCRRRKTGNKVVVMTGDGELDEGSNWESLLVAAAHRLDNLLVIVDRNGFQANMKTEDLIPLRQLTAKFEAFGCSVREIDGHDFAEMAATLADFPFAPDKPSVLIARHRPRQGNPEHRGPGGQVVYEPDGRGGRGVGGGVTGEVVT